MSKRHPRETGSWIEQLRQKFVADDPRCRRCWDAEGTDMHHKTPVSDPKCVLYDEGNLTLLCPECHVEVHRGQPGMGHNIHNLMSPDVLERKKKRSAEAKRKNAMARYKRVRYLHEDCGMSWKEVGQAIGKTAGAAYSLYRTKGVNACRTKGNLAKRSGKALMITRECRRLTGMGLTQKRVGQVLGITTVGVYCAARGDEIIERNAPQNNTIHYPPAGFWATA